MDPNPNNVTKGWRRWWGSSALVAAGVFLVGRLAVEPMRTVPQYDDKGMDPFGAVEKFRLKDDSRPFSVAMFGSSVSIWGVLPGIVADELKLPHHELRKLAVVGGTAFDHWKLVERNPHKFSSMRVALIEINPRMAHPDLESDERLRFTIGQHATWHEREQLRRSLERKRQRLDVVLPIVSVRRSLRSLFLNCVQPEPGAPVFPTPDYRLYPLSTWHVPAHGKPYFRDVVSPPVAAHRLVENWRLSRLQDECLRKLLDFLRARGVRVILYQLPVHPDVVTEIRKTPNCAEGYERFMSYVDSLGVAPEDRIQLLEIAECGVPKEGMRDLTHFNEVGAKIYSHWLGSRLRPMLDAGGALRPE